MENQWMSVLAFVSYTSKFTNLSSSLIKTEKTPESQVLPASDHFTQRLLINKSATWSDSWVQETEYEDVTTCDSNLNRETLHVPISTSSSLLELQHALLKKLSKKISPAERLEAVATSLVRCISKEGVVRSDVVFALLDEISPLAHIFDSGVLIVDPRGVGWYDLLNQLGALSFETIFANITLILCPADQSKARLRPERTRLRRLCGMCLTYQAKCRAAYRHPAMKEDGEHTCDWRRLKRTPSEWAPRSFGCCEFCDANEWWSRQRAIHVDWTANVSEIFNSFISIDNIVDR